MPCVLEIITSLLLSKVSDVCEFDLTIQSSVLVHRVPDNLDSTKQMLFHET